jgi:ATP/ADP translocase
MRDKLFSLLGIESGEEAMVTMLLAQSVFIGVFFGAFDISAHSLFLSIFDEKMMAKGYVVSGVGGIILTSLYTWLQARIKFKNFAVINLIVVTLLTLILWVALILNPEPWVIFIVFIMLGPLNILAMLGFWGTTGRLFTLRQGKRLFGLVDAGLIIGIIVSCYTIPILLSFNFDSHNILLFSVSSILIATVFQVIIGARFKMVTGSGDNEKEKKKEKTSVFAIFRKDRYTRIMGVFIALSVITAFFVQYSFMAVTREQYPAEADMARFLGIFTGSMMIFTLLVKLLVFSYLIRNYGLRTCLAISPILIAAFTVIAITVGMLMGYTPEATSGFMIFFLLMALSRLFSKSLKDSIESPSFKVIYQTIDEKVRYEIQSVMDGTVNEIAALFSGLILAGLGILSFIKLIHFSWVLSIFILLWVYIALKLYKEYRKSIRKALETGGDDESVIATSEEQDIFENRFAGEMAFKKSYFSLVTGDYSSLDNSKNNWYLKKIIHHSKSKSDISLIPVLKYIDSNNNFDDEIRKQSSELIKGITKNLGKREKEERKIIHSKEILSGTRLPQTTEILRLLRDNSVESKRLAIYMIGKFKLSDMLPEVCECLNIPGLETDASEVLKIFGADAVDELIRYYLVASGNIYTSKTILRLLGLMPDKASTEFLFSRLWSNSRILKEVTLKCLVAIEITPSPEEKDRLNQLISDIVGLMTWNLSAKVCIGNSNDPFLLDEMIKEINRWNRFLFNTLSITYDSGSVSKIRENLESDTVESVNYALEMMDIVIDDAIKPKLISLLDIVADEEKLKNLYQFFPGEIPQYNKLLEDIINRDYNFLSIWIKACVLRNLSEIDGDDLAESVVALLFSPEIILQEESARLVARSSRELYKSASVRLPVTVKSKLDKIINGESDGGGLIFDKVKFLSTCFLGIIEEELLSLAQSMIFVKSFQEGSSLYSEDSIIWPLKSEEAGQEVYIQYSYQTDDSNDIFHAKENTSYYILSLYAVNNFNYQFPDNAVEILNYIDKYEG